MVCCVAATIYVFVSICSEVRGEEIGGSLLAIETKARTVGGRGEKSLLSEPGYEVRLRREREKQKCEGTEGVSVRKNGKKIKATPACGLYITRQ